jgi:hypothetical protein
MDLGRWVGADADTTDAFDTLKREGTGKGKEKGAQMTGKQVECVNDSIQQVLKAKKKLIKDAVDKDCD